MKLDIFEKKVQIIIRKYNLLNKKDRVVVALSGGKDSVSVLYILHKLGYNVSALMIDLRLGEWSKKHKENMQEFCNKLGVKLTLIDLRREIGWGMCSIKQVLKQKKNLSGCTVCGIIKKWILNKYAKKLKFDKIATGHNLDDECQTVLLNFLKGNVLLGIGAKPATGQVQKNNKNFVQRVKPLFFIPEDEIRIYSKKMKFPVIYEKCPCAFGTYRIETREWMDFLTNKEKLKIVEAWQKLIPKLENQEQNQTQACVCQICGEPARGKICNACKLFSELKN